MFINPYDLIGADKTEVTDVRLARKIVRAEIELSGGEWSNGRITLSRWYCVKAMEGLADEETRNFYKDLLRLRELNDFLTYGDVEFFSKPRPQESIFKKDAFVSFISAHFAKQYSAMLKKLIYKNDPEKFIATCLNRNGDNVGKAVDEFGAEMEFDYLLSVLRFPALVNEEHEELMCASLINCFTDLRREIVSLSKKLEAKKIKVFSQWEAYFTPPIEFFIVNFAKKMARLFNADEKVLKLVAVLAFIHRNNAYPFEYISDRGESILEKYASLTEHFLDGKKPKMSSITWYHGNRLLHKQRAVSVDKNISFQRMNFHTGYFFGWLAEKGFLKTKNFSEREHELLNLFLEKKIFPSDLLREIAHDIISSADIIDDVDLYDFCDFHLQFVRSSYFKKATGFDMDKNFPEKESWEDYEKTKTICEEKYQFDLGTAPLYAAVDKCDEEKVRELIASGADVNHIREGESSAIWMAVLRENFPIAKMLIDAGADPNLRSKDSSSTPLHNAAQDLNVEMVKLLLGAGANAKATAIIYNDRGPLSCLEYAITSSREKMEQLFEIYSLLVKAGASAKGPWSRPIVPEIYPAHVDIIPLLLKEGADMNEKNEKGQTGLLRFASWNGKDKMFDTIKKFIEWGSDPFIKNADGKNSLEVQMQMKEGNESPQTVAYLKGIMKL